MKKPDFPDNVDIIIKWGAPFKPYGKKTYRTNSDFFAELYFKLFLVRYYSDAGMFLFYGEGWSLLSESEILNEIEKLILETAIDCGIDMCGQITEQSLQEIVKKVKRRHSGGEIPVVDDDVLPARNCLLRWDEDLGDFLETAYTENEFILNKFSVDYSQGAPAPEFTAVLNRIMPDLEDQRVAQEMLGAMMFCKNRTRKFLLCYGEGGCGKSVLVLLLIAIMTDKRFFDLQIEHLKNTYELASLKDQTCFTVSESISEAFCTNGGEWIKKAIGGDFIETKQKFKNEKIKHYGLFSLIVVSNNTLRFSFEGRRDEWRDRLVPIFFNQHIPEEERDKELVSNLLKKEGPGILNWLLDGARRIRRNKWKILLSPAQKDRIESLLAYSDPMTVFVQNHISYSAGEYFLSFEAWKLYVNVREKSGFPFISEAAFYKKLSAAMDKINHVCAINSLLGKKRGYRDFKLK